MVSRSLAPLSGRIAAALLALALLLAVADPSEAKRLGGGKSFGGKPSYSKPYDAPPQKSAPGKDQAQPAQQNSAARDQQAAPGQQGNPAPGGLGSRFGGFGGMVGGLLMGGLLGSLLFGGAGGGFGLLELLLVVLGGTMLLRFLRSRQTAQAQRPAYAPAGPAAGSGGPGGWDALRSAPSGQGPADEPASPVLPAGVDPEEFLAGAKALYGRLQASWDRRDLDDIRGFTSAEVFAEIARQAEEDPAPGSTEVLLVEARVLEVDSLGGRTVITLLFDSLLREDQAGALPAQVREVWRISRNESDPRPQWVLEGIQQLAQ